MNRSRPLVQLLVFILVALLAAPAVAQRKKEEKKEPQYPQASREDRSPQTQSRYVRKLQQIAKLSEDEKFEDIIRVSLEVVEDAKAKPADKAVGYQNAAYGALQLDDYERGLQYLEAAIGTDALGNDNHYQMMWQVVQIRFSEEQYEESLKWLDRFMAETNTRKADHLALKGNALYRLDRFEEAAAVLEEALKASDEPQDSWAQLLMASYADLERPADAARVAEGLAARNPTDKRTQMNLAAVYAQADDYDRATATLEKMRAAGMFTEDRDYRQLYAMYFNMDGKETQAIEVINEGIAKGVLGETAEVYVALAQAYYFSDKFEESIAAYRKAVPLAKDGEPALNLARVLSNEERFADSKSAAQEAIAKGVRKPGDAWLIIARAEYGANNKAGMIAAYREAAKYPESKEQAEQMLRRSGQM
jgi:tetratricopeptide (TPR) repeat protein